MPDRASELAQALRDTEAAVRELSDKVDVNEVAAAEARKSAAEAKKSANEAKIAAAGAAFASKAALAGWVFDMILTIAVGWGLFGVNHNQDRINDLQNALQLETERNRSATCAMVTLFLQFEPRTTTNPSYTDEQRQEQVQAYQKLRSIGRALECAGR